MLHPDGHLKVNLKTLGANFKAMQSHVGADCIVAPVVKANAYGLGAVQIVGGLIAAGCCHVCVAKPAEAMDIRAHHKDITIYILNGFYQSHAEHYITHNLTPVIGSFMEIEEYKVLSKKHGIALPAFLKFNTRMNRLGLGSVEQKELFENPAMLDGIQVVGVMSHLACADELQNPMNGLQRDLFFKIAENFPNATKCLSNSDAVFIDRTYAMDMVRPGNAIYGVDLPKHLDKTFKPIVSLKLPVIRTRIVYKDATIGYGATYTFKQNSPLATVAAGYADGLPRTLSNKGALYWNGVRCPIRGRVSMDLITVDLSDIPDHERPKPGDMMEVIGENQTADDLAKDAGTIAREILTSLGTRYKREYISV